MRRMRFIATILLMTAACVTGLSAQAEVVFSEANYDKEMRQVMAPDQFPVLHHPPMATVMETGIEIDAEEPVIGLFLGGEARAYPISVMGGVELVNDTCGEIPVAVSW